MNVWQPSAATALEARQTLSFTYVSNGLETDFEETGDVTQYVYGNTDYSSVCEDSGGSISSYYTCNEINFNEDSAIDLSKEPGVVPIVDGQDCNDQQHIAEPIHASHQFISSDDIKQDVECDLSQKLQNSNVTNENTCSAGVVISQHSPEKSLPITLNSPQEQVNQSILPER